MGEKETRSNKQQSMRRNKEKIKISNTYGRVYSLSNFMYINYVSKKIYNYNQSYY